MEKNSPLQKKPVRRERPKPMLRQFEVGAGLPSVFELKVELQDYMDVLLAREEPPVQSGVSTLMEVADAYFARASEIAFLIHAAVREGKLSTNSQHDKFRRGELRDFLELSKRASDLGSRRITARQMEIEEARLGRGKRIDG